MRVFSGKLVGVASLSDLRHRPSGGAVTLRLRETGEGKIEFSVTDTGPGIPDTDRERVTQRFVRLDNSRTKPGSGLGLSLVQAIVDVHNGQFELTEGPGVVEGGHGPGLRASPVPTLVLQGACDYLPFAATVEHAALLPNGRYQFIDGAGHDIWWERPDAMLAAIEQFLDAPTATP